MREWLDVYAREGGGEVESKNPDTREGADFAAAYDIVEYPTIAVLRDDGKVLQM